MSVFDQTDAVDLQPTPAERDLERTRAQESPMVPGTKWGLWLPLVGPAVPLLGYVILQRYVDWSVVSSVLKLPVRPSSIELHAAFAYFIAGWLCAATVSAALIGLSLRSLGRRGLYQAVVFGLVGAAAVAVSPWAVGSFPLIQLEARYLLERANVDACPALVAALALVGATCPIVALTLVRGTQRVWDTQQECPEQLVASARRATSLNQLLLTLTAVWLVLGIVDESLFHRLTATAVLDSTRSSVIEIGRAATVLRGAFLTLALTLSFGSAELLIREPLSTTTRPETEDWLEANRFGGSLWSALGRVAALLSPLTASIVAGVIDH